MTAPNLRSALPTLLLLAALAAPAAAVDIWVTRYDDPMPDTCLPSDCSLREAVRAVNHTDDVVNRIFLSAGIYELAFGGSEDEAYSGDLDLVADHIEILGVGANLTTIDGNGIERIFDMDTHLGPATYLLQGLKLAFGATLPGQQGSAMQITRADVTVRDCEIFSNSDADGGDPSTIEVSLFGHLLLQGSTVAGNAGNGLLVSQASATIENSTFSGNSGREIRGSTSAAIVVRNSTIFGSDANEVSLTDDDFPLEMSNSIVVGGCQLLAGGTLDSGGGNVESPGHTCSFGSGDVEDVASILLGTLKINGGSTRTHLPQISSAAVGGGNDATNLPSDQRGGLRPEVFSDSGSVEWLLEAPSTPLFVDGFGQGDAEAWSNF
jgi:hypothetical protein